MANRTVDRPADAPAAATVDLGESTASKLSAAIDLLTDVRESTPAVADQLSIDAALSVLGPVQVRHEQDEGVAE